ncbi:MAG TPA: SCO family protein [Terriglobales bacterium]|nr:SCO family protein [Terriglobales bacterium]
MRGKSIIVATFLLMLSSLPVWAQGMRGPMMNGESMGMPANQKLPGLQFVGIEQHLNAEIPGDLAFRDELGNNVKLGDYFAPGRPVILNLGYYQCPMLCGEVLQGLTGSLKVLSFDVGKEFDVVTVSFDPHETPDMAATKKRDIMRRYGRTGADKGWHFLTGPAESINALTKAVGFQFQWDEKTQQYAHATTIVVLTPDRHVAQYFYGVEFPPKDLRLGLIEASQNKIGSFTDQMLLYCYHYDPRTGKYGAIISRIMSIAGAATILFLGAFIFILYRADASALHKGLRRAT